MYACPECGWEYPTRLAAQECAEFDRAADRETRARARAHQHRA